ncbi:hypothetical protein F444_05922 [Phytophthora nicotianae P1976]|uniref:Uncharacterized protein n=1 Tax=Phytophthora nicotianae P1976 TaxID=1317066 RepID=A0A081AKF1_PHYNI|nr:hypothetical protein F444_05922 [Phytophthora nicotianae P1976]
MLLAFLILYLSEPRAVGNPEKSHTSETTALTAQQESWYNLNVWSLMILT